MQFVIQATFIGSQGRLANLFFSGLGTASLSPVWGYLPQATRYPSQADAEAALSRISDRRATYVYSVTPLDQAEETPANPGDPRWADPYRNAMSDTLEGKLWLAACSVHHAAGQSAEHEFISRRVAQYAFDRQWPIWHALWFFRGCKGHCGCMPCERARKAAPAA